MRIGALLKLARVLPKHGRLIYCLYRDPRTPRLWKVGLLAALGAILAPFINFYEVIPVVGELETVALVILAVEAAVRWAPKDLVAEHEAAIAAGTSYFHKDLEQAKESAEDARARLLG
jgi:uncharacterized membrane protein YkvA (DUF1232 family)